MLRLVVIAVASFFAFFPLFSAFSIILGSDGVGAAVAAVVAFAGIPFLIGMIWRRPSPGSKCPDGKGLYPECLFVVSVSEEGIVSTHPDGTVQKLTRAELTEVAIETNSSGPWGADVWWSILGKEANSRCVFPGGATGEPKVIEWVHGLPNFDTEAFIRAMGSTSEARFVCWRAAA